MKLIGSLVIFLFLYARESWTLTAELEKCHFYRKKYKYSIYGYIYIMDLGCEKGKLVEIPFLFWQVFQMKCYRRLLNISYKDHVTNEEGRRKIEANIAELG